MQSLLVVLLVVLLIVLGMIVASARRRAVHITGGADGPKLRGSPGARARAARDDVVIDTLNLTHHLLDLGILQEADAGVARAFGYKSPGAGRRITKCTIIAAIRYSAPVLRERFPGRIIYVIKDRDTIANTPNTRTFYQRAAREANVHIHMVEKPKDAAARLSWQPAGETSTTHQRAGRDDFYLGLLAWKLRCGALTEDRMRDFEKLKTEVDSFVVYEMTPWGERPVKNFVNPGARDYARVFAPTRLRFEEHGLSS